LACFFGPAQKAESGSCGACHLIKIFFELTSIEMAVLFFWFQGRQSASNQIAGQLSGRLC
jgi:hypothetical protein